MATVTNPGAHPLRCDPLDRELAPHEVLEVTDAEAKLVSTVIFEVNIPKKGGRKPAADPVEEPPAEPED